MALEQRDVASASSARARWGRGSRRSRRPRGIVSCSATRARGATMRAQANIGKSMDREVQKGRLTRDAADRDSVAHRVPVGAARRRPVGIRVVRSRHRGDRRGSRRSSKRCFSGSRRSSPRDAMLATNTSSLSVASIASACTASGARGRNPLLQSGAGDAARRGRAVAGRQRRRRRRRPYELMQRWEQDAGARVRYAGIHRQPNRASVLRRSDSPARGRRRRRRRRSIGR